MGLMILPALAIFLLSSLWAARAIRVEYMFHNPLVAPIIFWALSYPVRYVMTLASPHFFLGSPFSLASAAPSVEVLFAALLFAAAFVAMIGVGVRMILPLRKRTLPVVMLGSVRFTGYDQLIVHVIFIAYAASFVYLFAVHGMSGLYVDFEQLKKSFAQVILGEIANLKWFVAALCLLAYFCSNRRIYLIEALLVLASVLLTAFATTAKGTILNAVVFALLICSISGRRPPYGSSAVVLVIGMLFGVFSYEMRRIAYFDVREPSSTLAILSRYQQIGFDLQSILFVIDEHLVTLIDRITYYGDALVLMINGATREASDLYALGSLVELGNLIPRIVWEDRPHLSFNHYVTGAVWGMPGMLSETPIGRIGEAYYVASWLGFLVGFAYAVMFSLLCLLWHKVQDNLWGVATWCSLFMVWVLPDAYFTYGLKQVLVSGCAGYGLYVFSRMLMPASDLASKQR